MTLYSRAECALCDEARRDLMGLRAEGWRFELDEVDIESDRRLHSMFLERIPVVEIDGDVISELVVDMDALRKRLDMLPA